MINDKKINQLALEKAVVHELSKFPGIFTAISSTALQNGDFPDTPLYRSVMNNYYAKRSGNVYGHI